MSWCTHDTTTTTKMLILQTLLYLTTMTTTVVPWLAHEEPNLETKPVCCTQDDREPEKEGFVRLSSRFLGCTPNENYEFGRSECTINGKRVFVCIWGWFGLDFAGGGVAVFAKNNMNPKMLKKIRCSASEKDALAPPRITFTLAHGDAKTIALSVQHSQSGKKTTQWLFFLRAFRYSLFFGGKLNKKG